ncbi:DsbA family protein [Pontibaca salina]|uniref:DsbA family protein n=1 Tax=Pontibaca salina TaxID=2795731 RepID=A0A934M276_9RHOB|nr:DsbA family protein [Pontibaca salina]MBI6628529.1 DsbA family protein [Pontibaca salina]
MSILNRRTLLVGGLATGGALGTGALLLSGGAPAAQELTIDDVLFDPANPVLGNPDGDVTIVEFFDYQCPYCKSNHPALSETVAADGNIRLVMKDWPIFGAPSIRASQLVLGAAEIGAYENALNALMATQGRLTEKAIEQTLTEAGLDVDALDKGYRAERRKWDGLMARNGNQAAQLGIRGTPAFIIGTTIYSGAMSGNDLKQAVAQARG